MKNVLMWIGLILFLGFLTLLFSSCKYKIVSVESAPEPVSPASTKRILRDSRENLFVPPQQWTDVYGDDYESRLHFTLAVLNARVNKLWQDVNSIGDPNTIIRENRKTKAGHIYK